MRGTSVEQVMLQTLFLNFVLNNLSLVHYLAQTLILNIMNISKLCSYILLRQQLHKLGENHTIYG